MQKIATFTDGKPSGWILPIYHDYIFPDYPIRFVYLTAVAANSHKGPYLHKKRRAMFVPISGCVSVVVRKDNKYFFHKLSADSPERFIVDADVPFAVYNHSDVEAVILNLADYAWTKDDEDNYQVYEWNP